MYYTLHEVHKKYKKGHVTVSLWIENGVFPGAFKTDQYYIPIEVVDGRTIEEIEELHLKNKIKKLKDKIIGEKFGALEILDVTGEKLENGKQKRMFVEVGCECGEIKEMPFYNIERGSYKYCSNECPAKSGFYIGQQIYNLTITGDLGIRKDYRNKGRRFVNTICVCGKGREVQLNKLKSGSIKSCSKHCPMYLTDIIGEKYGYLTVLEELKRTNDNERLFLCKCDCGKEVSKRMNKLTSGHTKYCWHDCEIKTGEGSATCNPELSWEDRIKGRDYYEYTKWREKVYIKDNFTCKCCNQIGGNLVAHHKDGYNWCLEKRTDVHNGVTLCEECHIDFHKQYGFGDNTEEQYMMWLNSKKVSV